MLSYHQQGSVTLTSTGFCDIYIRPISHEVFKISIRKNENENYTCENISTSRRGQWVS